MFNGSFSITERAEVFGRQLVEGLLKPYKMCIRDRSDDIQKAGLLGEPLLAPDREALRLSEFLISARK